MTNETVAECLPFAKGYLIPGDYAVAGIDLTHQANPPAPGNNPSGTYSTGDIIMSGVPYDADILEAYLFWETIHVTATPSQAEGVQFRGNAIDINDEQLVKRNTRPLNDSTASCFSSGTPLTMSMFRADVLQYLPFRKDSNNKDTQKRLVNTADLTAHGLMGLRVRLPVTSGNQLPESAGASLLVIYRDAANPDAPLRSIVFYDGIWIQPSTSDAMVRTIEGFYKADATANARLTHITGSGQPNGNERILFNGPGVGANTVVAPSQADPQEPFFGGTASQRAWGTKTVAIPETLMDSAETITAGTFGEQATTTVDHMGGGSYDCLAWGAVIFSTNVADEEDNGKGDGLPDALEDNSGSGGLLDPTGATLPDLQAMGALTTQQDLFIEVNAMEAEPGTTYGGVADAAGHNHLPTPEVLKMVGDAYAAKGIKAHFDVGNIDALGPYRSLGVIQHSDWVDNYQSAEADTYLIPTSLARGGEIVTETACEADECLFPDWPGTVGWEIGLLTIRDAPVADGGQEVQFADYDTWETGGTCGGVPCQQHRRRFDRTRRGLFHYLLYAHARGKSKSGYPCLINNDPAPYPPNSTSCAVDNPEYRIPASTGGIANQPGGNALITLGLWDEYVGRPYVRAVTTFHELGHNFNLWHGGRPADWGDKAPPPSINESPSATFIEANCKPNYLSSMNYIYAVHGLLGNDDSRHLNYSEQSHPAGPDGSINETSLSDGAFSNPSALYRPAWYAPADSDLALAQGATKATSRFCTGVKFFTTTLSGNMNVNATTMGLTRASGQPLPATPFHVVVDSEIILVNSCSVSQQGATSCNVTRAQAQTTAASHSTGAKVTATYVPGLARVVADTNITPIDWDGDPATGTANQDVNHDGNPAPYIGNPGPGVDSNAVLFGHEDWSNVRLNLTGAGRNYSLISGNTEIGVAWTEFGVAYAEFDVSLSFMDQFSVGLSEFGVGQSEFGVAAAEFDFTTEEFSVGQSEFGVGLGEFGVGLGEFGVGLGEFGVGLGEMVLGNEAPLSLEKAREIGRTAPTGLTTCFVGEGACKTSGAGNNNPYYHRVELNWSPTTFDPANYIAEFKVLGSNDNTYVPAPLVACPDPDGNGPLPAPVNCAIHTGELPNGVAYTYRLRATFSQAPFVSPWSVPEDTPTTAFNNAPQGSADTYEAFQSTQLSRLAADGVLNNDADNDSPACAACAINPTFAFKARRAELLGPGTVVPATNGLQTMTTEGGTIVLRFDGSFTYTPKTGYTGPDSFTYRADDGPSPIAGATVLSPWTGSITVNITVKKLQTKK